MVDISNKTSNIRTASASCIIYLGEKAYKSIEENQNIKGDVITVAKIAAIQSSKLTHNLIPLCHSIALDKVEVDIQLQPETYSCSIKSKVITNDKTGVEMEALMATSIGALTIYDMCKAVNKSIKISDIQLDSKTGGKSGDYNKIK